MASERIRWICAGLACVLAAFAGAHGVMSSVARWVELEQDAYLWWGEEWMQLLVAHNFEGRGEGRILLTGSSEGREGFLPEELRAELPDVDVYNNSYSNHTLGTLLLVLEYLEAEYGPGALPDKLVIGASPWFLFDDPSNAESFFPGTINRYSPRYAMDVGSTPPRLVPKGPVASLVSRWRFLTHQANRYHGAAHGALTAGAAALVPFAARLHAPDKRVVLSMYHHLPPMDQREQLEQLRASPRSSADPGDRLAMARAEFAALRDIAAEHDIDLYVVNMPQSTWMLDQYFGDTYARYQEELGRLTADIPYLDLSRFLSDDEFYDILHANREAAGKLSRRVARFIRESDGTG